MMKPGDSIAAATTPSISTDSMPWKTIATISNSVMPAARQSSWPAAACAPAVESSIIYQKVSRIQKNDILFVGYQAIGTHGRAIQDYADKPGGYVYLDGDRKTINAKVHNLTGYSAHADQKGLVDWIDSMPEKPGAIKLVHGEGKARKVLGEVLEKRGYAIQ